LRGGDGGGGATQQPANAAPEISSLTASPTQVAPEGSTTVTCQASDSDDDTLTYAWSATGGTVIGTALEVTWTAPTTQGSYTITCTVSDGTASDTETVTVTVGSSSSGTDPKVSEFFYLFEPHTGCPTSLDAWDVEFRWSVYGSNRQHLRVTIDCGDDTSQVVSTGGQLSGSVCHYYARWATYINPHSATLTVTDTVTSASADRTIDVGVGG